MIMLAGMDLQGIKKRLWYAGQEILDNPVVRWYFQSRLISRDELAGHPAVIEFVPFEEGETVQYTDPLYTGILPSDIANHPQTVSVDNPFICEFENVQLIGPTALSITADGEFVAENALGWHTRLEMGAARSLAAGNLPLRRPTTNSYEFAISLVGPWCRNYYHWIIDYLTRLRYVKQHYGTVSEELPTLILPNNPPEWMTDGVRLAGFTDSEWTVWNNQRATVDRLVVPSLPRSTSKTDGANMVYETSPSAIHWLRRTFLSNLPTDADVNGPDRILVSREAASERRIRNKDAFTDVLDEYGFSTVRPENYSLPQQVSLFSQAEAVIGATGAGLVNTIFADDLSLLVLYGSDTHPVYYVLGQALGFDVGVLQCDHAGGDLTVDPEEIRALFSKMGIEHPSPYD